MGHSTGPQNAFRDSWTHERSWPCLFFGFFFDMCFLLLAACYFAIALKLRGALSSFSCFSHRLCKPSLEPHRSNCQPDASRARVQMGHVITHATLHSSVQTLHDIHQYSFCCSTQPPTYIAFRFFSSHSPWARVHQVVPWGAGAGTRQSDPPMSGPGKAPSLCQDQGKHSKHVSIKGITQPHSS